MCRVNQALQILGPSIATHRSKWQHAVISPIALARETCQGHKFYSAQAKVREIIQFGSDSGEVALGRKGSYVKFVNYRLVPRPTLPVCILPVISKGIDHFTRSVYA